MTTSIKSKERNRDRPKGFVRAAIDSDIPIIEAWLPTDNFSDTLAINWECTKRVYQCEGMLVWEDEITKRPVAYFWGSLNTTNSILEIQPSRRGEGIGNAVVEHLLDRSRLAGEPLLEIEAAPTSSEPFWRAMGFSFKGDIFKRTGRRILVVPQALPAGPRVAVKVSFFSELTVADDQVQSIAVHELDGVRGADGVIRLSEKVACFDLYKGDLFARVEVDGVCRFFNKTKSPAGILRGFSRCMNGFVLEAFNT